jgi:hypothetical protein
MLWLSFSGSWSSPSLASVGGKRKPFQCQRPGTQRGAAQPGGGGGWYSTLGGGATGSDRGPALPVRLQPGPGATRLIVGQPPGRFPVSRNRAQVVAFTIAASLMIAPAVAGTPIYLSADPPKAKIDSGPSLSLGRVGPDLCPGGFCRTEPNGNLYNFITPKGPRPSSRCQEFC